MSNNLQSIALFTFHHCLTLKSILTKTLQGHNYNSVSYTVLFVPGVQLFIYIVLFTQFTINRGSITKYHILNKAYSWKILSCILCLSYFRGDCPFQVFHRFCFKFKDGLRRIRHVFGFFRFVFQYAFLRLSSFTYETLQFTAIVRKYSSDG